MCDEFPAEGRLAGIDYGTVRIGIAISDSSRRIASPLANYARQASEADAAFLQKMVADEDICGFVVGLPLHLSGDESPKSIEARAFGKWLRETTGLPVRFHDERFSSAGADEFLAAGRLTSKKRKNRRDMLAAQIILSSYLESSGEDSPPEPLSD
jgi:putative Holliday junction resolvase